MAVQALAETFHKQSNSPAVDQETTFAISTAKIGLWMFIGTVAMLFAGFASAFLVRKAGTDWQSIPLPPVLWLNTGVLLLSSLALERARGSLLARSERRAVDWTLIALLLGVVFAGGQWLAWTEMAARGLYLPSSPHSSFFYMLTAIHCLHLLGGLIALPWALNRVVRQGVESEALSLAATYWHFVGALWVFLFYLLFGW